MKATLLFIGMLGFLSLGCGPKMISGLNIPLEDTGDHRALIEVIKSYRMAYEAKNIDGLLELVSSNFYETAGTPEDTSDDYSYNSFREHFSKHFEHLSEINLNISLKGVQVEKDKASIDYHYVTRYLMKLKSGDKWQITDDINRMELVRENNQWKIVSGI